VTDTRETNPTKEQNEQNNAEPPTKNSLSFKLAFIGLAASLLIFQLDATYLSIALPVSLHTYLHQPTTQKLIPITRPLPVN
jgi:hypothetical protein